MQGRPGRVYFLSPRRPFVVLGMRLFAVLCLEAGTLGPAGMVWRGRWGGVKVGMGRCGGFEGGALADERTDGEAGRARAKKGRGWR